MGKAKKETEGSGEAGRLAEARAPAEGGSGDPSHAVNEAWKRATAAACELEVLSEHVNLGQLAGTPYDGDTLLCAALEDVQEVVRLLDEATW